METRITILLSIVAIVFVLCAAGCASPAPGGSAASSTSNAGATSASTLAGKPTSANGHDYIYYHNLNDPSTCKLCHSNA